MRSAVAAVAATAVAAAGGALAVFGAYDDSPGGSLLGVVMILAAMVLAVRSAQRVP